MVGRDDRRSGTVAAFGRRSPVRRVCGRHVSNAATNRPRITIWHEPGRIGPPLDVGGFSFIDPPLADRNQTVWIFDHGSGLLVTADGFGIHHALAETGPHDRGHRWRDHESPDRGVPSEPPPMASVRRPGETSEVPRIDHLGVRHLLHRTDSREPDRSRRRRPVHGTAHRVGPRDQRNHRETPVTEVGYWLPPVGRERRQIRPLRMGDGLILAKHLSTRKMK